MESFVPLGGFFSAPAADIESSLGCSYHTASRCDLCNEYCKQEVNSLSKCGLVSSVSVADHYQSSLPSWLQMTELKSNGGLESMKVCVSHNSTLQLSIFLVLAYIRQTDLWHLLYGFNLTCCVSL